MHHFISGSPNEDPPQTQRFLLCLTVGVKQKATVHALVQKVSQQAWLLHGAIMVAQQDSIDALPA